MLSKYITGIVFLATFCVVFLIFIAIFVIADDILPHIHSLQKWLDGLDEVEDNTDNVAEEGSSKWQR